MEDLMDSADFDQLARSLVTPASRRRILAGALSAMLGLRMRPAGAGPASGTTTQRRGASQSRGEHRGVPACGATMTCPGPERCPGACPPTAGAGITAPSGPGDYCVRGADAVCSNGGCTPPAQCCT